MTFLEIIFILLWIGILISIISYIIVKYIIIPYKVRLDGPDFTELLIVLNATINTEIELWEKDVFSSKNYLTNSNFDNYYHEITSHIIDSLSDDFFTSMSRYLKPEAVVSIIGRKTKEYLAGKVNGSI